MTEACSSMTFLTLHDPMQKTSSHSLEIFGEEGSNLIQQPQGVCVGKAAPHVELKICADGRILTRGPHLMLRYWNQTLTNPSNHKNEVWLDTSDIGSMDCHGNLWLLGRLNGRIKSGGENIYPEEVVKLSLKLLCVNIFKELKPNEHAALFV